MSKVIDIHCHLGIPAADGFMQPYLADAPSIMQFSNPKTGEVNKKLFQTIGKKLNVIDDRIPEMDEMGIDIQAISPSPGQYYYFAEPDIGRQAARMINDGMAEAVAKYPDRLVGMGTVPMQDCQMAITEMERCMKELDLRGIEISTNVNGKELADPEFRAFFARAEELGILIFIHPLGFTHGERMCDYYLNNIIGNPIESTLAISHLIFGGVLEAHPGLNICVAHGGGYIPTYQGRMDHAWRVRDDCCEHIARAPSEYLRQFYFDTLVFNTDHLDFLVEQYGADKLCLGTDYPFDMAEPDPVGFHKNLSDSDKDKILGGTAAKLLRME